MEPLHVLIAPATPCTALRTTAGYKGQTPLGAALERWAENTTPLHGPCAPGTGVCGSDGTPKGKVPRGGPRSVSPGSHMPWARGKPGGGDPSAPSGKPALQERGMCSVYRVTDVIGSRTRRRGIGDAVSAESRAGRVDRDVSSQRRGLASERRNSTAGREAWAQRDLGVGLEVTPRQCENTLFSSSSTAYGVTSVDSLQFHKLLGFQACDPTPSGGHWPGVHVTCLMGGVKAVGTPGACPQVEGTEGGRGSQRQLFLGAGPTLLRHPRPPLLDEGGRTWLGQLRGPPHAGLSPREPGAARLPFLGA